VVRHSAHFLASASRTDAHRPGNNPSLPNVVATGSLVGSGPAVSLLLANWPAPARVRARRCIDLSWRVVTPPEQPSSESDIPEQFRIRQAKRERLLADGRTPYPVEVARTHTLAEIRRAYPDLEANTETGQVVGVAGRVMFARNSGKLCFATLQEGDGTHLQAMISLDRVGQESLDAWKSDVDLGDIVFVHGEVISSRRGELSVLGDSWQIVSKALRPLPVAHKEMSEEARVRQRYVDLIVRPEARTIARQRVAVVRAVREALHRRGFLEVETPMLQTLAGGAAARPFVTHSNALDADLYLRIAPELFLKRCLVGGFERVFELNRVFRNEGADSTHSPEFAMLETYQAYGTYDDSAVATREIIQEVADEAIGTRKLPLPDGSIYDIDGEWDSIQMYPSLSEALGEEISPVTPAERLWQIADRLGVDIPRDRGFGHGKLVEELWEHTVGNKLWAPTFVRDFPVETTPLTAPHRTIEGVTEKWDLYVRHIELATGYSELIDPVIQRERFEAQARAAAAGDDEAMALDEDFLAALEYAMPPSTGTGMGIDRLLMALTGLSIRETVLFPIVRRQIN
jgi:lysyl-tRNA synthetase class 2